MITTQELTDLLSRVTPGEWHWLIHDYSMASLGVGDDPGMGTPMVLSVSPCGGCTKRAEKNGPPPEWKWGRCCTPTESDVRLIALAPQLARRVIELTEALEQITLTGQLGIAQGIANEVLKDADNG